MVTSLFRVTLLLLSSTTADHLNPGWSYYGQKGVNNWSKHYQTCNDKKEGSRQSPIDIDRSIVEINERLTNLTLEYDKTVDMTLWNVGTKLKVEFDNSGMGVIGGGLSGTFLLDSFHFHWGSDDSQGSEHTIDGKAYPMEMHIVNYAQKYGFPFAIQAKDGLAVLGFLFEISDTDNIAWEPFISILEDIIEPHTNVILPAANLKRLLPESTELLDYYRYDGSLTTPGCYETVTWTVFRETIKISEDQMEQFRALKSSVKVESTNTYKPLVNNYRPVQNLHARKIYSNFLSAGVNTSWSALTLLLCLLYALIHNFV